MKQPHEHEQGDRCVRVARKNRPRHAVDEQRDEDRGEGQLHVGGAHDEGVETPAGIPRDQSQTDADQD